MPDEGFKLGDAPATSGYGNLGPVPAVPGKRKYTRRNPGEPKPERQPRRPRQRVNTKLIYQTIGTGIAGANKLGNLNKVWKESLFLRPDEVTALSVALGDEALSHKQLIKWLEEAAENMVHIKLATVVLALTVPRLALLGLLPKELIDVFSVMVEQGQVAGERGTGDTAAEATPQPTRDDNSTVPDGTGGTRVVHGPNGERKEYHAGSDTEPGADESWERAAPETVQDSAPVEAG